MPRHWKLPSTQSPTIIFATACKNGGWGYTHDHRADKNPYPHDRRADKDSYPHDRNVTDDLCSLIKFCCAFIMVNFST